MPKIVCQKVILFFLVSMAIASPMLADSTVTSNGQAAMVGVAFKIEIPPCLELQVKTAAGDNMLASRANNARGNAALPDRNDQTVNVTASANVTKHGVLNISSRRLPTGNTPASTKRKGHGAIESLPLPYISDGQYRLEYTPSERTPFPIPGDAPAIILCSP